MFCAAPSRNIILIAQNRVFGLAVCQLTQNINIILIESGGPAGQTRPCLCSLVGRAAIGRYLRGKLRGQRIRLS